jgi:hypothetical protein
VYTASAIATEPAKSTHMFLFVCYSTCNLRVLVTSTNTYIVTFMFTFFYGRSKC